ncbi:MAG: type I-U CRISPR-associated protein Csx17, partial [Mailhella sp.]|nr:type I-U CRISPR-associated protein Csx17 [Mailhella sp.]
MPEHILHGCQSKPLASYLKALGILRLVSEQSDSTARGSWQHGVFCLSCRMDREVLLDFFLEGYQPSPLVSPWNGGSGFYPGDNKAGIEAVSASDDVRLSVYREAIACIFNWPEFRELEALPTSKRKAYGEQIKKGKERILQRCRSTLPDECLPWLDAAYALREDKAFFPPLLGTGGNEGRLEFSNNFMQRVCELFHKTPADLQEAWLKASLFDVPVSSLPVIKVGQFDPGNAGGINQSMAFKNEDVQSNPWDFIFMLEGTLLFASALVRRSPNDMAQAAAPFSVSSLSAGFASSHLQDKGRGEVWMPLWSHPATVRELRRLLGEGRASLGREKVREDLDFARAAALLGVDRGIDGFERFSLLERRGQSYVALPSGTVSVGWRQPVALLDSVGEYLKLRPLVKEDRLPASFTSARRRLT